jgi:hypothetical protein
MQPEHKEVPRCSVCSSPLLLANNLSFQTELDYIVHVFGVFSFPCNGLKNTIGKYLAILIEIF